MLDFRPILLVVGLMVACLGISMFIPAIVDILGRRELWREFLASGTITCLIGFGFYMTARGMSPRMTLRQAFLMTVLTWVALCAFGAIPIYISGYVPNYTDAFFESISALTTTGATVMTGLDEMPGSILLWRAMLQWLGGLGVIVMAIAVLPVLQIGGLQIFKAEAFDTAEKILPSATQISGIMTAIYTLLTAACSVAYLWAGMAFDDALMHAMTTVSTGGFSTKDASMGHFDSAAVDMVCIFFMCVGSLPFLLYIKVLQGNAAALYKDSQVQVFFLILLIIILLISWVQIDAGQSIGLTALRHAAFNVTSIMTGTGYATQDYQQWGTFAVSVFFFLMFVGGCAGSTTCSIKIFRWQVLFEDLRQHINRIVFPNGVFVKKFNGETLPDSVSIAVMSFFFLYFLSFAVLTVALSLTGLDALTALSGAGSAISNVGPALGDMIGPSGTYTNVNDVAKWLLGFGMLLGRLEIFTVLVLLSPAFWRM